MAKKPGLGRGLDALLGGSLGNLGESPSVDVSAESSPAKEKQAGGEGLHNIPVDMIQRGKYQPRTHFDTDALQELADSIRAQGVVQPIVVRPLSNTPGHYELIAGERRWRASQLAGLHDIPAVVRNVPDQTAMAIALIENIQRQELNVMEEAHALQRLVDEFGLTQQEAAEAVGRSRVSVTNMLRLLSLEKDVRHLVEDGKLEMGHARALLGVQGAKQVQAAWEVVKKGLSVRETEQLVRKLAQPAKVKPASGGSDPDIRRFEDDLSEKLGAKVQFQHNSKNGKGKLVIQYNSMDELDGILEHIK